MIESGKLTERLDFYLITEIQSESGYKQETETLRCSRRAQRLKNKEKLVVNADEVFHSEQLVFRLRKCPIEETDTVRYNGLSYSITEINEFPNQNEIKVTIARENE